MGAPEMKNFWDDISKRYQSNMLDADERKFFKKFIKALDHLRNNPRHNSLQTHEIAVLSKKYGIKIYQSYLENKTPAAGRIFWAYGPGKTEITILGLEPHPEKRGYEKVKLSDIG